jgi:hypothetical protein
VSTDKSLGNKTMGGSEVTDHGPNYTRGLPVLAAVVCEFVSVGVGTYRAVFSDCFSDCVALWVQFSSDYRSVIGVAVSSAEQAVCPL